MKDPQILVIDDDTALLELMTTRLQRFGLKADKADDNAVGFGNKRERVRCRYFVFEMFPAPRCRIRFLLDSQDSVKIGSAHRSDGENVRVVHCRHNKQAGSFCKR